MKEAGVARTRRDVNDLVRGGERALGEEEGAGKWRQEKEERRAEERRGGGNRC